jgi:D-sedoheptulose 7-phosphate isomerase
MNKKTRQLVSFQIKENGDLKRKLMDHKFIGTIGDVADAIIHALGKGKKILLFGNGGSAADAQHIAAELVGKYQLNRDGLPALALTTNTSSLTAISNDWSFDHIFTRQLEALGQPGDVAIGITTSGKSRNIITAFRAARNKKMVTVALTGSSGAHLKKIVDLCVCVPSEKTPRIQEAHILIGHILCDIIENSIFKK